MYHLESEQKQNQRNYKKPENTQPPNILIVLCHKFSSSRQQKDYKSQKYTSIFASNISFRQKKLASG